MDVTAPAAQSLAEPRQTHLTEAVRAALRRLSWRIVTATLLISLALDAWLVFDIRYASALGTKPVTLPSFTSGAVVNLAMALCIMLATLVADEVVASGANRLRVYGCAVVTGCGAGTIVQWAVHRALHLPDQMELSGQPSVMHPWAMFFEYIIWGSVIVFLYVSGRTALLAAARLHAVHLQREETQRRTLESRLQALQARVEPQFLLDTLAQVHALYRTCPAHAGQLLSDLIGYLRSALPHLRESTSTLERELALAGAYRNIMRARSDNRLVLDIDVAGTELAARMPSMVLLPLVNHALLATDDRIRISACTGGDLLRVELSGTRGSVAADGAHRLQAIRERLEVLYGARAMLRTEPIDGGFSRTIVEIPYEPADGGHR